MLYFINPTIIKSLDESTELRLKLAIELGVSERAIYNNVKRAIEHPNQANGSLTKYAAIKFFETLGYKESEIILKEQPA